MWYRLTDEGEVVEYPRHEWPAHGEPWRRVAHDEVGPGYVSTVFLGLDHGHPPNPTRPLVFETMMFGIGKVTPPDGLDDGGGDYQERYRTIAEAREGHARAVEFAKAALAARLAPDNCCPAPKDAE